MALLPLDYQNLRNVRETDTSGVIGDFVYVTRDFIAALCAASLGHEFAYIETEYHGGAGGQGAILFRDGAVACGPAHADVGPINAVLRQMGVSKSGDQHDEFDAVGLVEFRSNEEARKAAWSDADLRKLLNNLYAEIGRLGALIDAPPRWLPNGAREGSWLDIKFFEGNDGDDVDGYWICLCGEDGYECGIEHPEALLEYVFGGLTHKMAMAARKSHEGGDARRSLFAIQEALLSRLNKGWAERKAESHRQTLKHFPFNDA